MSEESQCQTVPLEFNPRSPEFRANPYPTYHYLRTHHPIYYRVDRQDWVLTRYTDIVAVLQNPGFGHSEQPLATSLQNPEREPDPLNRFLYRRQESQELIRVWLVVRNPPIHTQLRQIFHNTFTQARIQALHYRIQALADNLIDSAQQRGEMDIIEDLAYPLSVRAICEVLGISKQEEHRHFPQWLQGLSRTMDLDATWLDNERGMLAIASFAQYFRRLIAQWPTLSHSQDNLINTLIKAHESGKLSEAELLGNCILMFFGGHSTTKHWIGNCILTLLNHPEQLRLLQADPSLIEITIAEILRYDSPVQVISRTALSDINLSGQIIYQGQRLRCILAAANRDPAEFPDPDNFDIKRQPNASLSFGRGIHFCIGVHLAKLVTKIAVGTLVRRLPGLSLATESLQWEETFILRGLKSLPVLF